MPQTARDFITAVDLSLSVANMLSLPTDRGNFMYTCMAPNCEKASERGLYCRSHYRLLKTHGNFEKIVKGDKTTHPLYGMWNKRRQKENALVDIWIKDFYQFLKDIGDKPANTFLARKNKNEACGPNNFYWKSIFQKLEGETAAQAKNRQVKEYRIADPKLSRSLNYKYNFGITINQYEEMLKLQNNVCFICKNPETSTYKNTGVVKNLAVDHCHETGKIRKLLCAKCNLLIGKMEDNWVLLDKMIKYILDHK